MDLGELMQLARLLTKFERDIQSLVVRFDSNIPSLWLRSEDNTRILDKHQLQIENLSKRIQKLEKDVAQQ